MIYLAVLGALALFGVGVYVGTLFNGAKLKAIDGELQLYARSINSEARSVVAAVRKHL